MPPFSREAYLEYLRENPDGALRVLVFDLVSPIANSQGAAKYLSEALQSPGAEALDDIEVLREAAKLLISYLDNSRFVLELAAEFVRAQKNP